MPWRTSARSFPPLHDFTDALASEKRVTISALKPVMDHITTEILLDCDEDSAPNKWSWQSKMTWKHGIQKIICKSWISVVSSIQDSRLGSLPMLKTQRGSALKRPWSSFIPQLHHQVCSNAKKTIKSVSTIKTIHFQQIIYNCEFDCDIPRACTRRSSYGHGRVFKRWGTSQHESTFWNPEAHHHHTSNKTGWQSWCKPRAEGDNGNQPIPVPATPQCRRWSPGVVEFQQKSVSTSS